MPRPDWKRHPERPEDRVDHEEARSARVRGATKSQPLIVANVGRCRDVRRESHHPPPWTSGCEAVGRGVLDATGRRALQIRRAPIYWICCADLGVDGLQRCSSTGPLRCESRKLRGHGGIDLVGEDAVVDRRDLAPSQSEKFCQTGSPPKKASASPYRRRPSRQRAASRRRPGPTRIFW